MKGRARTCLRAFAAASLLLLAGCGGGRGVVSGGTARANGYEGTARYTSCVPFARQASGIALSGDAWQWWDAAAGLYARSDRPRVGSVLVLRRTGRLRDGHLSVVTRVISAREVLVDHANWASGGLKGLVAHEQPVIDVSPGNDWTAVRVWYPPAGVVGSTVFPSYGFIHHGLLQAAG